MARDEAIEQRGTEGGGNTAASLVSAPPTTAGASRSPRRPRRQRRRARWRTLLAWRVQVPLLCAAVVLAFLLGWQVRRPFILEVGGPDDAPYLSGFHAGEVAADSGITYRWTRDRAAIAIPGYGAAAATLTLRLQGVRPPDQPSPLVTIQIGAAAPVSLALGADLRDYTFPVAPASFRDAGLTVTIEAPTFQPKGDARSLGVVVDRVELRDDRAPAGLVLPPLAVVLLGLGASLAAYATVALLLGSPTGAALAGWATAALLAGLALGPRAMLALYARDLLTIVLACALVTTLAGLTLRRWGARAGWAAGRRALGGAALIGGAELLVLLAGMRHPQFRSSDLLLNVHRLEFVQRGEWIFTLALPGERALEAPYPPLFYAVMLPFAPFVRDTALLVEATAAVFIAAGALLTFGLARRIAGEDAPALWAAGVSTLLPITYAMSSAGNFANLFGQGIANVYLVALILAWDRWARPAQTLVLTAGLTLALLGHFGVFLSLLVTVPLLALVAATGPGRDRRRGLALGISFVAALIASWAIYYHFHDALLLGHLRDFLGGNTNARGAGATSTLWERLRNESRGLVTFWGWPALPLGLAGMNLLLRLRPVATGPGPQALRLTLGWLATAVPFILAALVASLSVRFHLFVGPALAVCCGWALWQLWRTHRYFGPAASLLLTGIWAWQTMAEWIARVLHAYH